MVNIPRVIIDEFKDGKKKLLKLIIMFLSTDANVSITLGFLNIKLNLNIILPQ